MAKKRKRIHPPRWRRSPRRSYFEDHVDAFLDEEEVGRAWRPALLAAMPEPGIYHTSHWLLDAIVTACRVSGRCGTEVTPVLEQLQRWAHRTGRLPQVDAALQLCGIELLRRKGGCEARTIVLPEPVGPADLPVEVVRRQVVAWEASSYAAGLACEDDPKGSRLERYAVLFPLLSHLARADGVPVRFAELDVSAYAIELHARETEDPLAPPALAPTMLDLTAGIYEELSSRDFVPARVATRIMRALDTLALGCVGPSHAA